NRKTYDNPRSSGGRRRSRTPRSQHIEGIAHRRRPRTGAGAQAAARRAGRGCGTGSGADREPSCGLVRWSPLKDEAPVAIAALHIAEFGIHPEVDPRMAQCRIDFARTAATAPHALTV